MSTDNPTIPDVYDALNADDYEVIEPTPFQNRVIALPEDVNLLLAGGRGGGKSECVKFIIIKHAEKYGRRAKMLYVRETWEAIDEFEKELALMILRIYGPKQVAHHKTDHTFTWPSGAVLKLSQLATEEDYGKFQGKSFTMIICDEYGARKDVKWVWLLASNMRAKAGIPTRMVLLANPGGSQHGHIQYDFIAKSMPWGIFEFRDEPWISAPSTLIDNPHIDRVKYIRKLRLACGNDEDLLKAWLTGDWNINRGAYFAGSLDELVHKLAVAPMQWEQEAKGRLIGAACPYIITRDWRPFIMQDWGSGAPCLTYIGAQSPGVVGFPKDSLIIVDELGAYEPDDLNVGLNWAPPKLANAVKDFCKPWGVFPAGVADEAYGLDETLIRALNRLGVFVRLANKERVAGWQLMRKMFNAVKERNGPGLWLSERCHYFWKTAPYLLRDPKYPEDIVTKNVPDHGADAVRYGVMHAGHGAKSGTTEGT